MIIDTVIDLIFPLRCPVCDRPVPFKERDKGICPECVHKLNYVKGFVCTRCGRPMYTGAKEELLCDQCKKRNGYFNCDRGFSLCIYDDVMRKLIYRFKYAGRREYGDALGHLMGKRYKKIIKRAKVDGIVPVPLHEKRFKKRGYNQSELLAKGISEVCDVPYYPDYVLRVKNTAPMKTLSGKMRQNNLKKAFKIGQNDVKLKKVVVVDDIYTTGSTVEAVAHVLKEAGVKKVYFLTLSTGDGK